MKKTTTNKYLVFTLVMLCMPVLNAQDFAQSRALISSGGKSTSDNYQLKGSMGQVTAVESSGGQFSVQAGFWQKNNDLIFEDEFE